MEPIFFASPSEFRHWLEAHGSTAREVLVGFHKVATRRPSMTWAQSVDEALCFGWIDGVRRNLGPEAYTIRFTPRKPKSPWSKVNLRRFDELEQEGRMTDAGRRAHEGAKEALYSYEKEPQVLSADEEALFRENAEAWQFFDSQAPSYRRVAIHWIVSAKQQATRERRLQKTIECSAIGRRLPQYEWRSTREVTK